MIDLELTIKNIVLKTKLLILEKEVLNLSKGQEGQLFLKTANDGDCSIVVYMDLVIGYDHCLQKVYINGIKR